jgi:hypothetical protein
MVHGDDPVSVPESWDQVSPIKGPGGITMNQEQHVAAALVEIMVTIFSEIQIMGVERKQGCPIRRGGHRNDGCMVRVAGRRQRRDYTDWTRFVGTKPREVRQSGSIPVRIRTMARCA